MVSFFGSHWQQVRKDANVPCMDPVTGTHPSDETSTLIKALIKREVSSFNSGRPLISGYKLAIPFCRASISAFTPTVDGGSPGTPISILINSTPDSFSALAAMAFTSRIVALEKSVIWKSSMERSIKSRDIGVAFMKLSFD